MTCQKSRTPGSRNTDLGTNRRTKKHKQPFWPKAFLYFQTVLRNYRCAFKMATKPRALVLFTGTGSVDSLEAQGFEVDNLDIDKQCNATWTTDILDWESWRQIPPGTYDFVWASPPCRQYSIARTTAKTPRNLALADSIVARTLEIIRHLQPKGWLMENPATGILKTRGVVGGLPFTTVCY